MTGERETTGVRGRMKPNTCRNNSVCPVNPNTFTCTSLVPGVAVSRASSNRRPPSPCTTATRRRPMWVMVVVVLLRAPLTALRRRADHVLRRPARRPDRLRRGRRGSLGHTRHGVPARLQPGRHGATQPHCPHAEAPPRQRPARAHMTKNCRHMSTMKIESMKRLMRNSGSSADVLGSKKATWKREAGAAGGGNSWGGTGAIRQSSGQREWHAPRRA